MFEKYFKKRQETPLNNVVPPAPTGNASGTPMTNVGAVGSSGINMGSITTTGSSSGMFTSGILTGGVGVSSSWFTMPASPPASSYVFSSSATDKTLLTIYSAAGKELVRLNKDGSVEWAPEVDVNEASRQFEKMLNFSVENKLGISHALKCKIRDQVFEDVIRFAKEKGALTADDLTFMLESSKIIEKLKGTDE